MKTITRTITLYSATELKEKFPAAFQKALEKYNDGHDEFWQENVTTDFLAIAPLMGFTIEEKDVQWRGFHSQGDGASFTGSAVFDPEALEKVKDYAPQDEELHRIAAECARYGVAKIRCKLERSSHHYSHENTVGLNSAWIEDEDGEIMYLEDVVTTPCPSPDEVLETCRDFMRWLYKQAEKEYEYRCSEECFLETAEANEWTFTADGIMDNG